MHGNAFTLAPQYAVGPSSSVLIYSEGVVRGHWEHWLLYI